jgi:hypothetical protein
MYKLIPLLFICSLLAGCAIKSRKEQSDIRTLYAIKEYGEALKFLEKSSIKKEKQNELLYLMEKGRILYTQQKYYQASQVFLKANDLVDKLYTKKVREKILSAVGNDNSETYYGSPFERSMLYYYQAQSYYKLYQIGHYFQNKKVTVKKDGKSVQETKKVKVELSASQKSKYLNKARASIVAWNTFFQDLQRSNSETLYRNDLMGKLFAANIHETIGFRDRQITLQLYKDARKFLMTQGHTYKHFDSNFKELTRDLQDKLGKKKLSLDSKKFKTTNYYQDMLDFLNYKILTMTWKIRRGQYSRLLKRYNPSKEVRDMLKNSKRVANVAVVIEREVVAPMEAKKFEYSLNSALESMEDPVARAFVQGVGIPIITYFAMGPLGLGTVHRTGNTVIYTRHNIGTTMVKHTGIEFEMPLVKERPVSQPMELVVYKKNGDNETLQETRKLVVASPNHDIAMQAANERAGASYKKVGLRVALKHAVAIVAAYKTYTSMKKGDNDFIAKTVAFAQYMASSKGIAASEKADIRHWSTLPGVINLTDLYLPKGEYRLAIRTATAGPERTTASDKKKTDKKASSKPAVAETNLGTITVNNGKKKNIFTYQL